eukprot:gnl/MRDRNA2_/MRDRNA2_33132_c0_seq1.p1 gnl/MRDRNA2_/MRDRNA2_33132_c0~~gnl/MRDRNA2_/MRDRNA2_33132_c0_seq1.p1  ORF type:complete len:152 (+),score=17.65 gnl/MRDRNA2_/MRDRNA2_33132_c0_seq1:98-553(+)
MVAGAAPKTFGPPPRVGHMARLGNKGQPLRSWPRFLHEDPVQRFEDLQDEWSYTMPDQIRDLWKPNVAIPGTRIPRSGLGQKLLAERLDSRSSGDPRSRHEYTETYWVLHSGAVDLHDSIAPPHRWTETRHHPSMNRHLKAEGGGKRGRPT